MNKRTTLGSRGISHLLLPLIAVIVFAVAGTFMLVAKQSDTKNLNAGFVTAQKNCPSGTTIYDTTSYPTVKCKTTASYKPSASPKPQAVTCSNTDSTKPRCPQTQQRATTRTGCSAANSQSGACQTAAQKRAAAAAKKEAATKRKQAAANKKANTVRTTEAVTNATASVPTKVPSKNPAPVAVAAAATTSKPAVPKEKPQGSLLITTFVDDPALSAKGGRDDRLGNVNVSVSRMGGPNNCKRKDEKGKTNNARFLKDKKGTIVKDKDGKEVLVKGTINYKDCDTGDYTITLIGKDGYSAVSDSTKKVHLSDDEIQKIFFVLKKN